MARITVSAKPRLIFNLKMIVVKILFLLSEKRAMLYSGKFIRDVENDIEKYFDIKLKY